MFLNFKRFIILSGLTIFSIPYYSQLCAQPILHYKFNHFSQKSGLSSIYVRKIIQDPYGFIWVGTQDGLNRFDGKNFIIYNKGSLNKHEITGPDIRDLAIDSVRHLIWSTSSFGGIDAIDYQTGAVVYKYTQTQDSQLSDALFLSLALHKDQLFIGSSKGLFVLDIIKNKIKQIKIPMPFGNAGDHLPIDKILIDKGNSLWIFCGQAGVLVLNLINLQVSYTLKTPQLTNFKQTVNQFYDVCELPDRSVLAGTNAGLLLFIKKNTTKIEIDENPIPLKADLKNSPVYTCRLDNRGSIWFSMPNHLIKADISVKSPTYIYENTSKDEFEWLNSIYSLFFDRDNYCWLGCQQGLAYAQNEPCPFIKLSKSPISQTSIGHAYYINPLNDTLLYCCAEDGLYKIELPTGYITALDHKKTFYHILEGPGHELITSNINGTFVLKDHTLVPIIKVHPEFIPFKKLVFNSHTQLGDSVLILGTENLKGIIVWNFKAKTIYAIDQTSIPLSLKENIVNGIYKDSHDLIWILGDNSISILNLKKAKINWLKTYSSVGKYYSIFFDACEVRGNYYVSSYGSGIIIIDSNFHVTGEISTKDGLSNNNTYKVIPFKDSLLFVTSNNGLSVIDLQHNNKVKTYFESDGLQSNTFEENSGGKQSNIIYAGGVDGLTAISPELLKPDLNPPKLFINRMEIQTQTGIIDTTNFFLSSIKIPENVFQTTIYYSALAYSNPERILFNYKIKELNSNWIDLGTDNFIKLIGLSPGKYTLQIRSANENGIWNEHPLELQLIYLPKWYQTWWFKLLILGAIAGLLYSFYRYRISQIRQQQRIRRDIASDLHDDIGSTLNTVKIFTHLAKKEEDRDQHLQQIEESLTQATIGLRDMVWVLDDSQDTLHELLQRINKFAIPVTSANHIQFHSSIETDNSDKTISKTEKRNLLLIAKETINNSIKYAACTSISIIIQQVRNRISLSIRDDGKGFDLLTPSEGNGLKNIYHRARQIHYKANITSAPGQGTTIEIIRL